MITIIKYTGKPPHNANLRGAAAKNKRRKKKYNKVLNIRKECKDFIDRILDPKRFIE